MWRTCSSLGVASVRRRTSKLGVVQGWMNCAGKAGPCGVGDWVDVQTVIPGVVGVQ